MAPTCWTLSDGVAGNRRQTRALAAALGLQDLEILLQPRAPWCWLAPRRWPGAASAFGPAFANQCIDHPPTLAIGCGRQAALATRLLGERSGCHTVQILDPRIDPTHWSAVIAPAHDGLRGDNIITTLGSLNPVDDAWLAAARQRWPALASLPTPRTLLLLGGPTAAVPFGEKDWAALADCLTRWLNHDGGSLLISSSRRTPGWLSRAARARFADVAGQHWHGPEDGENPYPGLLAWADRIVVTADSVNQLSEACATGVPVCTPLPPRPTGRIARFHRGLLDSGRLRPLSNTFEPWSYPALREAAEVAAVLRGRLHI